MSEYSQEEIRAAAILTTSYVATTPRLMQSSNQLTLHVAYTKGSSTGLDIKVEFSADYNDSNPSAGLWVQENYTTTGTGIITHTVYTHRFTVGAPTNYVVDIPALAGWYRVSAKALTSGTGTSCQIIAIEGSV